MRKLNEIVWHRAENLIKDSLGDVLVIFDCCSAGNLGRDIGARGHWARRAFEFLGATTADDMTQVPGPDSFTSGLIWALEQLATEPDGFTTSELLRKIHAAPHFPKDQWPVLHDRDKPSLRKIIIAPLLEHDRRQTAKPAKRSSVQADCMEYLDLRFSLSSHPTAEDIENFGHALKDLIVTKSIPVRNVAWGKLSAIEGPSVRFHALARGVTAFKSLSRRSRNKSLTQNGFSDAKEDLNGYTAPFSDDTGVSGDPGGSRRKRRRVRS
jgi:hypothetical protein